MYPLRERSSTMEVPLNPAFVGQVLAKPPCHTDTSHSGRNASKSSRRKIHRCNIKAILNTESERKELSCDDMVGLRELARWKISDARATAIKALDELFYSGDHSTSMRDDGVARIFGKIIDSFLDVCVDVERMGLTTELLNDLREETRGMFEDVWLEGEFGHEIVEWPRRARSAKATQLIYDNGDNGDCQISSLKNYHTERLLGNADLGQVVRDRKEILRDIVEEETLKRDGNKIRMLDLANDPCFALPEVIRMVSKSITETLREVGVADRSAQEAKATEFLKGRQQENLFFLVKENVLGCDLTSEGPWDICFSTDRFDFLDDRSVVNLWSRIYGSLNPDGIAVISVKDRSQYYPELYRWLMRWDGLLQRRPEEFEELLDKAGILDKVEAVIRESSGIVLFYVIRK